MGELTIGIETSAGLGPPALTFDAAVEAFCREQDELRSRLARAGSAATNPLTDQRNGNGVTDDQGGRCDGQA